MELADAIQLIDKGVELNGRPQVWADLGAGHGLFSQALSTLLPDGSTIYAVDKDHPSGQTIQSKNATIDIIAAKKDFTAPLLDIPVCDGLLMANSLHFVKDKLSFLRQINKSLQPGRIIIVEYDTDNANRWVPWPVSCKNLQPLFPTGTLQKLASHPSKYQSSGIYSALIIFER